jgi:hypothetical protein
MAASITQQLSDIEEQMDGVMEKVNADAGASPALKAVVAELHTKTREARDETKNASEQTIRDHIIEAEEAADSAKHAAEAETQIADATRQSILDAHDALCELKGALPE